MIYDATDDHIFTNIDMHLLEALSERLRSNEIDNITAHNEIEHLLEQIKN